MIAAPRSAPAPERSMTSPVGITPSPNDRIESMTGRRHLSWSQLTSFRGCPRKWHFSHVEGRSPAFVPSSLVLGSAFHAAVQRHYTAALDDDVAGAEDLMDAFDAAWTAETAGVDRPVRFGRGEDAASLRAQGRAMLGAFLSSELAEIGTDKCANAEVPPASPTRLIAIEETLAGTLDPRLPHWLARIDLAWLDERGLHLLDFKTSRSKWSDEQVDASADQLRLYRVLAEQAWPNEAVHLHFGVVTKTKSPTVQHLVAEEPIGISEATDASHVSTTTGGDAARLTELALPVWHAMDAGVDFTNPNPMNCAGCGYRSICPAHPRK